MWIRFPIYVAPSSSYEDLPRDAYEETWLDVRQDAIIAVRQFIEDETVCGSVIFLIGGDEIVVGTLPSRVKELLNYSPIKA